MTADILTFPLVRRLSPAMAALVDIAARRADDLGHPCDRNELALMVQRWRAEETPHDRELLAKAREAIAKLPQRKPR